MEELIPINQDQLIKIKDILPCPSYDRKQLQPNMVHIGVGGFHRAHQAYYLHQLSQLDPDNPWGIVGVGIREADRKIYEVLQKQDGLYTLLVKHFDGTIKSEIIGSIMDILSGANNPAEVINRLSDPQTKIVSLTITEGGYDFDPSTLELDLNAENIQHDLQDATHPKTIYGYLCAALAHRKQANLPGFTLMSCDNIIHNGDLVKKMLLTFARERDKELAHWIEQHVSFPNTMVDRITPVTTQEDIKYVANELGLVDEWPVTCEPFIQWVIEDDFCQGRPAFEKLGVQFVKNVEPYEKMKLRLLNAGHSVVGILGAIQGFKTIDKTMEDPIFSNFMRAFMDKEATPILDEVPGIDLDAYKDSLEQRFSNQNIKDAVSRICSESSAKLPKFLIATIHENLEKGGNIEYGTFVLAAWCYYSDKGMNKDQEPIDIIDEQKDILHQAAKQTSQNGLAFLKLESIFGKLASNERFTQEYLKAIQKVYADPDVKKSMKEMLQLLQG